jgi:hypothetical protein
MGVSEFRTTTQVPVPVQAPPVQPEKGMPAGVAVRVILVPAGNGTTQVPGQDTPDGLDDTDPAPRTCNVRVGIVNVAVTGVLAVRAMMQAPVPLQAPLHPVNVDPAVGVAVRVMAVLFEKDWAQVAGQEIPAGIDVTVPVPTPAMETVRVGVATIGLNEPVMTVLAVTVKVQGVVPEQPVPAHPVKELVPSGTAVSVMLVPLAKAVEVHVGPQLMPPTDDVMVPLPKPCFEMETVGAAVGPLNTALTIIWSFNVKAQVPVPGQLGVIHSWKLWLALAVAVRTIAVPTGN